MSKIRNQGRRARKPNRGQAALEDIQGIFRDAVQHHQAGHLVEARQLFRMIVAAEPRHADSLYFLGLMAYQGGSYETAVEWIGQAIRINNDNYFYHHGLGNALKALGRVAEAVAQYERALVLNPSNAEAHYNLGIILNEQGKRNDAVVHYKRAVVLNPDHANAHNNLGVALMAQGKMADATAHLARSVVLNPSHADARSNLGTALAAQGRNADAIIQLERAVVLNPENGNAHNNLGVALMAQGRIAEAKTQFELALSVHPDHADAHANLGTVFATEGNIADAMNHLERAVVLNPRHANAHNSLGNLFKEDGKFDDAMVHFDRAVAIKPDHGEAHLNRSEIKRFHPGDADIAALEALAGRGDLSPSTALLIHFALAKALDDTGDYSRAFAHLRQGNALKRRQINYDEAEVLKFFQRISNVFDRSLFTCYQGKGDPSPVPVFVLGMPRSGSTLIEQILASHPQVHGAGELKDFNAAASSALSAAGQPAAYPECISTVDSDALRRIGQSYVMRLPKVADGQVRIVDKLPGNFLNIGLIHMALPNARIIHVMRHPLDTCVSCYGRLFTSGHHYTYDLAELGRFYRCYTEVMTHWRSVLPPGAILDVSYENVVDDLEGQARRLIEYCGLPWDDRCVSFHQTRRTVRTASAVQVRKPLFRSSLQRWRKYETEIAPLLSELETRTGCS